MTSALSWIRDLDLVSLADLRELAAPHVLEEARRLLKTRVTGLMPQLGGWVTASVRTGSVYNPMVMGATKAELSWECSCVASQAGRICAHAVAVIAAVDAERAKWGRLPGSTLRPVRPMTAQVFTAGVLSSDMGTDALRAWADSAGIRTLLDERTDLHGSAIRAATGTWVYGTETLEEIALGADPTGRAPELVLRYLLSRAEVVSKQRGKELELLEDPPEQPRRRELWDRLLEARAPLAASWVMDESSPPQVELDSAAAGLVIGWARACPAGKARSVRVTVSADVTVPLVSCACRGGMRPDCAFARPAIDAALARLRVDDSAVDALLADAERPAWSRLLDAADAALAEATASGPGELGFRVNLDEYAGPSVQLVFVSPKKRADGVALRPATPRELEQLVLRPLERAVHDMVRGAEDSDRAVHTQALALLVGHPRVFLGGEPVSVVRGEPRVALKAVVAGMMASLELGAETRRFADIGPMEGVLVAIDEDARRVQVFELPERLRRVGRALARLPEILPTEALPALLRRLSDWGVLSQVSVDPLFAAERRDSPAEAVVRLEWRRPAVEVRVGFFHHPDYPVLMPDEGPDELYVRSGDQSVRLWRNRRDEVARASALVVQLGLPHTGEWRFLIGDLDRALDLVVAAARLDDARAEWAGGKPLIDPLMAEAVTIVVEKGRNWFSAGGSVDVGVDSVPLDLLLRAIAERQRYVEVRPDTFVAIEERLLLSLQALAAVRGKQGQVAPTAAVVLSELRDAGARVEGDAPEWLERFRAAAEGVPALPPGLRAELRDYQRTGFEWLARLAAWAPGACLCDDMGLGKTVQAIALLLHRKEAGPVLVVGPTSVGFNWCREIARFAPELEARLFRGKGTLGMLEGVTAGVVVVTNYELMAGHADALQEIAWGTVVFDEAQALKNAGTQRARVAFGLRADFRLGLTGTPVENRVDELWSVFEATVPGLLGAAEVFRERFANPIGKDRDIDAGRTLARLIRPFVLRRLKSQVATELPPRTDIRLDVELSEAERARYDQLRIAALQALAKAKAEAALAEGETGSEDPKRRIQVLAALTRLRQAACHPRLLDPTSTEPSSKLTQLMEIIDSLRAEGHRALVFSQFARHLELVREALAAADIPYRLLDGATPASKRRKEVDAFQAGQGDVFLISLKAGGTGLNLTGADYVVHLDPWWNPAIEDQATDRAHRIGQTRPVTVYRLVARGTIEESILALHAEKRELVSGLLEGTDQPAALTTDDLVALLS